MNIVLVGNGFDLHHKFPTRYIDFLHVMQFLIDNFNSDMSTIGHVLGNSSLHEIDPFIEECYEKHKNIYDDTALPIELTKDMVSRAKKNMWFSYLCKCVSKDIKWIDFEKEVLRVVNAFESFFSDQTELNRVDDTVYFDAAHCITDSVEKYILSIFDFFHKETDKGLFAGSSYRSVNREYVAEKVVGSNVLHIVSEEMVSFLYTSLRELADILRDYLKCFIDTPSKEYAELGVMPHFASLSEPQRVFSFNYTKTFELLYQIGTVDHIHGDTYGDIVLGVNPDDKDNINSIDTTFLQFKKYYQRVFYKTDATFLRHIKSIAKNPVAKDVDLLVIGHSLDSTDEDVIKQIFRVAKKIKILYHDKDSAKNLIKNLVEIYGKDGLDELRAEKYLEFLPQSEIQWISK